jgi:hypothetical protein
MMGVLWTEEALKRRQILTAEERQALLGIPQDADSLARLFTLSRSDRHLVAERLSDASRLGFAVQLALLRHPGTVLVNLDQSPEPLVIWLATQLGIPAAAFAAYARRPQTMTDHARRLAITLGLRAPALLHHAVRLVVRTIGVEPGDRVPQRRPAPCCSTSRPTLSRPRRSQREQATSRCVTSGRRSARVFRVFRSLTSPRGQQGVATALMPVYPRIHDLCGRQRVTARFFVSDTTPGHAGGTTIDGQPYTGPVAGITDQYFTAITTDNINVVTSSPNVFIHTSAGTDGITLASGRNVVDGGPGSNFIFGGSGQDTFFVDGRGTATTWSTIANFHSGDDATIWGFQAGVSKMFWSENEGAAGYLGATLHIDLHGTGSIDASMTFSGISVAKASGFAEQTGVVQGSAFLHITSS